MSIRVCYGFRLVSGRDVLSPWGVRVRSVQRPVFRLYRPGFDAVHFLHIGYPCPGIRVRLEKSACHLRVRDRYGDRHWRGRIPGIEPGDVIPENYVVFKKMGLVYFRYRVKFHIIIGTIFQHFV